MNSREKNENIVHHLTSLVRSPRIFLEQILNSKANFKRLQNENVRDIRKNLQIRNQGTLLDLKNCSQKLKTKIVHWRAPLSWFNDMDDVDLQPRYAYELCLA